MNADFELQTDGTLRPNKGGRREGAGRKPGYSPKDADSAATPNDAHLSEGTKRAIELSNAKLAKAQADAKNAELKFQIDSGEYLSRSAYREASAEALASVASHIRQIPDILEKEFGLDPAVLVKIEESINESLTTLANELEMFVTDATEKAKGK